MNMKEYKEMHGDDEYETEIICCSECGSDWDKIYYLDGRYYCSKCFAEKCCVGGAGELETDTPCCICGEPITEGSVYCFDDVPSDDNLMDEECFWNAANEEYLVK